LINDLPKLHASKDVSTKIYVYADDAKMYKVINQISDEFDSEAIRNAVKKSTEHADDTE